MSARPASSNPSSSPAGDGRRLYSRAALAERPSYGASCVIPSALVAEALGRSGLDYVTIDRQHGLIGFEAMIGMLQALAISPVLSLVRVPGNSAEEIGGALDAGAGGVIVPMVESRGDAEAAVAAAQYPPMGTRSWGPTRAAWHAAAATDPAEGLVFVMIETAAGVAVADEIAGTPGVDGVIVGTSDLAVSLGLPPSDHLNPAVQEAAGRIARACQDVGAVAGVGAQTIDQARTWLDAGFRMLSLGRDLAFLTDAVRLRLYEYGQIGGL